MKKYAIFLITIISSVLLICACGVAETNRNNSAAGNNGMSSAAGLNSGESDVEPGKEVENMKTYNQIDQETAKEMMTRDDGHVIVDVRRQDEYDAGHIPGAILIPNESIGTEAPEELPDFDQIILIYCRSGNRSKQAAQKLADIGYTNIYEFGGINTWTGEIE